jgi:hypothetical protein
LDVLKAILADNQDAKTSATSTSDTSSSSTQTIPLSFEKPHEDDIAAYDIESVRAVRESNIERLRELWKNGKSLDACNPFGESLLHMACRRGDLKLVRFLVCEVQVRTDRCDDFGRNPFHDALWTSSPNLELLDLLMEHMDPAMLLAEDVRGNTPFAYARREHDAQWIAFLEERREKLLHRKEATMDAVAVKDGPVTTSA